MLKCHFFLSYYVSNEQYLGILEGFYCLLQQLLLYPWYMYFKIEFLSVYNLVKAFLYAKTTFNFGIYESQAKIYNVLLNKLSCRDYLPYSVSNDIEKKNHKYFLLLKDVTVSLTFWMPTRFFLQWHYVIYILTSTFG